MGKVVEMKVDDRPELLKELEKQKASEEFVDFKFGDLKVQCSCGHTETFMEGIEGMRIELPATNKHDLIIACSKCKHVLRLFYDEAKDIENLLKDKEKELKVEQAVEEAIEEVYESGQDN